MSKKTETKVVEVQRRMRDLVLEDFAKNGIELNVRQTHAPRISTGLPALDLITGGGLPVGMLTMFWGQEGSGKSTTTYYVLREYINMWKALGEKRLVLVIDSERTFDEDYAVSLGIDSDYVLPHRPEIKRDKDGHVVVETAEETITKLIRVAENPETRFGRVGLIIVDSMNALSTARSLEAGMSDKDMGNSAKMWTNFCRQFPAPIDENQIGLVVIAQMRKNLGVMYGSPDTLAGGEALKHMTRLRAKFNKAELVYDGKVVVGTKLKPTIVKSSIYGAVHHGMAELEMRYKPKPYIDPIPQLIEVAKELLILTNSSGEKAGAGYWYFQNRQLAIGEKKVTEIIRSDRDMLQALAFEVRTGIEIRVRKGDELPVEAATGELVADDFFPDVSDEESQRMVEGAE